MQGLKPEMSPHERMLHYAAFGLLHDLHDLIEADLGVRMGEVIGAPPNVRAHPIYGPAMEKLSTLWETLDKAVINRQSPLYTVALGIADERIQELITLLMEVE